MAGNGGLIRGQARLPSRLSISPVSSPQMYAAAPRCRYDIEVEAGAEDVLAEQPGGVAFVDRRFEHAVAAAVLVAQVEVGRVRLDRIARDAIPSST